MLSGSGPESDEAQKERKEAFEEALLDRSVAVIPVSGKGLCGDL